MFATTSVWFRLVFCFAIRYLKVTIETVEAEFDVSESARRNLVYLYDDGRVRPAPPKRVSSLVCACELRGRIWFTGTSWREARRLDCRQGVLACSCSRESNKNVLRANETGMPTACGPPKFDQCRGIRQFVVGGHHR